MEILESVRVARRLLTLVISHVSAPHNRLLLRDRRKRTSHVLWIILAVVSGCRLRRLVAKTLANRRLVYRRCAKTAVRCGVVVVIVLRLIRLIVSAT